MIEKSKSYPDYVWSLRKKEDDTCAVIKGDGLDENENICDAAKYDNKPKRPICQFGMECSQELEPAPVGECWCRDPSYKVCWHKSVCFQDVCRHVCPDFPKQKNKACVCDKTKLCAASEYCKAGECQTTPAPCIEMTYADPVLGCSCIKGDDGDICSQGQMCIEEDDTAECKEVGVCPIDSATITDDLCYCNITNSVCEAGGVCDTSLARCVEKCPDHPDPNPESYSCKCATSEAYCNYQEICGNAGCAPVCPGMPEEAPAGTGCYCGATKCSSGDTCELKEAEEAEEGKCWPGVTPCPGAYTIISAPACYCSSSGSLCHDGQICNDREEDCTDPYPLCPDYPETTEAICACHNTSLCEEGHLCSPEGVCRAPVSCQNLFTDPELQLEVKTEDPQLTEGHNISLQCNECHHVEGNNNVRDFDMYCKSDGNWNISLTACTPYPCADLSVHTESVEETTEGDTCQTARTFRCKNEMEYFEQAYGETEVTFQCKSRGWNISEMKTCSVVNPDNAQLCTTPHEVKCVFKVKSKFLLKIFT